MSPGRFFRRIVELKTQWDRAPGLPCSPVLTAERIEAALRELGVFYRERIYSPCVTLWMFVSQVLSRDHSCRDAVARLLAFRTAQGQAACSTATGSYCEARQRLPEELLARLTRQTGAELHEQARPEWRRHGRRVKLIDGSTVSMPDTPENAAVFGKSQNQHGRVGFPLARIMVLICLATGAVLDFRSRSYRGKRTGELSLFRELQPQLSPGDILLGDRLFGTYCDIARLAQQGVDVVFRLQGQRHADFRRGRRLGPDDHRVAWQRPAQRPKWLSAKQFAALPAELLLREVRVRVKIPGFRVQTLVVVTTLSDPQEFARDDIANLFRQRWQAELDLRSIKTALQMDVLRCLTPEMIRKELWTHLLAYNLLRSVMCAAADDSPAGKHSPAGNHSLEPRELSFKATLQLLDAFYQLIVTSPPARLEDLCRRLLQAVRQHRVGDRPNRSEPRKVKRAAKPYPALKKPRAEERKQSRSMTFR